MLVAVGCGQPTGAVEGDPATGAPVLFVHGYMGSARDWETMISRLVERGYPRERLLAVDFESSVGSSLDHSRELADAAEELKRRTGESRIDIVAHSMGALAARLYVQRVAGEGVEDVVLLAGANHGSKWGVVGPGAGAREVNPPYACGAEAINGVQTLLNGCVGDGSVDETPYEVGEGGTVRWLSIRSNWDEMIIPHESSCLNQLTPDDCSSDVNVEVERVVHAALRTDTHVFDLVLAHLTAR